MAQTKTVTVEQAIAAGHDEDNAPRVVALCQHLGCTPEDVEPVEYDHHGLSQYSAEGGEYAVGTDREADKACTDNIREMVWAFNASFILSRCDLPSELEPAIQAFQAEKCESANDALLKLVERLDGLENFVEAAVSADGRGHFLSGYDSVEQEETVTMDEEGGADTFYIYRTN